MRNTCETSEQAAVAGPLDQPLDERPYNTVNVSALAREHAAIEESLLTVLKLVTAALPIVRHRDHTILGDLVLDAYDALDKANTHAINCFALTQKSYGEA